ncbi:MAG: quinolinate synthase NadA, partial [Acidobacteriota bacterium]|nr:quinolinate synthase NadA [Acidobacteriota bacterium]
MNGQLLNEVEEQAAQQVLPDRYLGLSEEELDVRIGAARATLGERLLILGHHY